MVQISPDLLKVQPKSNGVSRNSSSIIALMKSALSSVLEGKTLKVQMSNEKQLQQSIAEVVTILRELGAAQKNLQIGKASLETQQVDEFRVQNLEKLNLENVESLAVAFEQLEPIIKSLHLTNQSDKQAVGLLNKLVGQVNQLAVVMREVSRKDVRFPAVQKVEGSVAVTGMPDHSVSVVRAIEGLKTALQTFNKKEPAKQAKIELSEGKLILSALQDVTDALQKLPSNMEFPTAVTVSNFPPQKYPNPVTNININPLRGFAKSRAVTVTTTPTPLPGEVLAYRRALVVYNNSSQTLYVGGSDVSSINGMPVPPSSYSPAFDAGPKMVVYGIVASTTANVRVLELSNENVGG